MLPVLDDYLTDVYQHPIEFLFSEKPLGVPAGGYEYLLILTTGYLDHPANAVIQESGWYDPILRLAWVKMPSPGWFDRMKALFHVSEEWKFFQGYYSAVVSHEVSHLLALSLSVPDRTHDFMNQYVYFDAQGKPVLEQNKRRFTFQRLK